jgi:uncharacterized membrane protein YsdA (DUF1294 family)
MTSQAGPKSWGARRLFLVLAPLAFFLLVGTSSYLGYLPGWILTLYLIASVLAFGLYAADKSAARREGRRMPESILHLVSLAGGWPGALVGQQLLHHKTGKAGFQSMFWVTVAVNCAFVVWLI